MKCSYEEFGDVAPGKGKGCYCDEDKKLLPYELAEGNIADKCGMEGEICNCTTTVHYGNGAASDFKEMSETYFKTKEMSPKDKKRGYVDCGNAEFGDVLPNKKKQCFCERPEKPTDLKEKSLSNCGFEGENCQCKGRVFYGRANDTKTLEEYAKKGESSEYLKPKDMFTYPWTEKDVFGSVRCNNEVFGDIAPG